MAGRRDRWRPQRPFGIGQLARITQRVAIGNAAFGLRHLCFHYKHWSANKRNTSNLSYLIAFGIGSQVVRLAFYIE